MLAQHGLALITEKLQNQRLEEPAAGSSGVTPSGATSFCGKLPTVSQETFLISDHPGQSASALSVKGKNVWAMSLESDRTTHGSHQQNTGNSPLIQISSPRSIAQPSEKDQSIPPPPPPSICRHKKLRHFCQICDTAPGTPSAPPKKKHCRSLSVPPDGPSTPTFFPSGKDTVASSPSTRFSIGIGGCSHPPHHHYHPQFHHHNSKIWRPIAVVPLRCSAASNNNSYSSDGYSNSQSKERITATAVHNYPANIQNMRSHAGANNDNNNNNNSSSSMLVSVSGMDDPVLASPGSSRLGSSSSSSLHKFKLMPPSSSSSASFDSGHFTTSDLQTPPSSPIPQPRPASAASEASYSSVGWFEFSPMRSRIRVLQNRSLSCEDRISGCSSCSCSSPSSSSSSTTASMPCVYNSFNTNYTSVGGGTGRGSVSGCCAYHSSSGGGGEVVPRCHSQPCVLHHRRCGKKRRRDCDRPTLNFNKMTETAYMHPHRKSEPWSSPSYDAQMRSWQGHHGFTNSSTTMLGLNQFFLNPIASSPLDSSEILMTRHLQLQPGGGGSDLVSERPAGSIDNMTLALTPPHVSPGGRRRDEDNEDEDEEEEEEEDEEERNCSCHDSQREPDSIGLFPMGDLDLEQIETH